MIVILSDKKDNQSSLLYLALLEKGISVKWVWHHSIKYLHGGIEHIFLTLHSGDKVYAEDNFFINRSPSLPSNHPLILFINLLPYNKVLTHPIIETLFISKIEQLKYLPYFPKTQILKGGYSIPKNTCVKSISQIRSCVRESNDPAFNIEGLKYVPVQFQKKINGEHVKVHLIGGDVYAYKFTSNTIDPRESKYKIAKYQLTQEEFSYIGSLKERIGLNYFDCDYIKNEEGIFMLEVNPSPAPLVFANEANDRLIKDRLVQFISAKEYKIAPSLL